MTNRLFSDYWLTANQNLLDQTSLLNPWNPPSTAQAKAGRTLVADYTFGTTATPLLGGATPITNITQLNTNFWNMLSFTDPIALNNGAVTYEWANSEWQTYVGTSVMSFDATDLNIQATLNAAVTTNTQLGNLFQTSVTSNNVTAVGSYTWTIATGLNWATNDPIHIDGSAGAAGTITSYNSGTGALVVNVTGINYAGSGTTWRIVRAMINSGIIRTKQTFLYGFFEASIWFPPGNGMAGAFWLLPSSAQPYGGTNSEIDIIEQVNNTAKAVDGTWASVACHGNGTQTPVGIPYYDIRTGTQLNSGNAQGPQLWQHSYDITAGFHNFQCLWVPGYCVFYIDDVPFVVLTQPWKTAQGVIADFADIILNLAVSNGGANFAGIPNSIADFPANLKVQWIRVWQSASEVAFGNTILAQQKLNLLLGTANMSAPGSWVVGGGTFTFNQAVDPTGGSHAARLTEDGSTGGHAVQQVSLTLVGNQNYTLSAYVKVGSSGTRNIELYLADLFFFYYVTAIFNPSTGALVTSTPHNGAVLVATNSASLGNGWFQVWMTVNLQATVSAQCYIGLASGSVDSYAGDSASNLLFYDPHLKQGNLP